MNVQVYFVHGLIVSAICSKGLLSFLTGFDLVCLGLPCLPGLPRSGKKFWKMKKIPGQGKVRELHFQSGKLKKK